MSGSQLECMPLKTLQSIAAYEAAVNSVTVLDVQYLVEVLGFRDENMTVCVGITGPTQP